MNSKKWTIDDVPTIKALTKWAGGRDDMEVSMQVGFTDPPGYSVAIAARGRWVIASSTGSRQVVLLESYRFDEETGMPLGPCEELTSYAVDVLRVAVAEMLDVEPPDVAGGAWALHVAKLRKVEP